MFEFQNTKYPQLNLASVAGRARFVDGRFATDDTAFAEALEALPEWYGIRLVTAPTPVEPVAEQEQEPAEAEPVKPTGRGRRKGGDA